jgi:hypothetical protein
MSAEFDLSDEPRQFAKGSSALAYGLSSNAKNLGVWPRYGARANISAKNMSTYRMRTALPGQWELPW